MVRKTRQQKKRNCGRVPHIESLQRRELMAADLGVEFQTAAINSASSFESRADAGSSISTALDLGAVEESASANGALSFRDRIDLFRFEVSRDGDVDIDLTGLRRNADLVLADESGTVFEASRTRGRASESISAELEAGTYFVGVRSRSFWGTSYQLNLEVELNEPAAVVAAPQVEVPVPDPVPSTSPLAPLSDVAYFGGSREWNLNTINAPEAWAAGYTGEGITVAVVDTGVDLTHPDLVENLYVNPGEIRGNGIDDDGNGYVDDVHGYDFAGRDGNPNDVGGHGTHVAGSIAAESNGFGATGVAPDATILPVRVLGNNGTGSTQAVAAGIRYAAEQGADIINLSLGGGYSRLIQSAIDYAQALGSLIIAAAGNESAGTPGFPARFSALYDNVLSVGAHNSANRIAGFSNDVGGSGAVQVDAPGVGIFSTYSRGRFANLSGTSMASPQVAGVAALALSANPDLTPQELRSLLVGGVTNQASGSDAAGIVNAATTVAYAAAGLLSPPVDATSSQSIDGNGTSARTFRRISFDGDIASVPIIVATATKTDSLTTIIVQQDTSVELASAETKAADFSIASTDTAHNDVIEIVGNDESPDPKAVDQALTDGIDHLVS